MQAINPAADLHTKVQCVLDEHSPLCREDIIWMLDYIKQKVSAPDDVLLGMTQRRLLQNFTSFAEIAMIMIRRDARFESSSAQLKMWLHDACFSLIDGDTKKC